MERKWTDEQKAKQAELIRQWQPWKSSTGPKTIEGKTVASKNAVKEGKPRIYYEAKNALASNGILHRHEIPASLIKAKILQLQIKRFIRKNK